MAEEQTPIKIVCAKCGRLIASYTQEEWERQRVGGNLCRLAGESLKPPYTAYHWSDDDWNEVIIIKGEIYCDECLPYGWERCDGCGEIINTVDDDCFFDEPHGCTYCIECRDEKYFYCDHCNQWHRRYDVGDYEVTSCNGIMERWCQFCVEGYAFLCENCNEYYDTYYYNSYETSGGSQICEACFQDNDLGICADCGIVFPTDELSSAPDGNMYCESCFGDHFYQEDEPPEPPIGSVIHLYHQYPNYWVFRNEFGENANGDDYEETLKARHKTPHFGIELEIDNGGESSVKAVEITRAIGFPADESYEFKCSRDGSLDDGFEIISMPATLPYHLSKYKWEKGMEKAVCLGYSSHDAGTCGLHFHVDREYFKDSFVKPEEGYSIIATNNALWLKLFSRRKDYGYCAFITGDKFTVEDFKGENQRDTQDRLNYLTTNYADHDHALNFSNNATIELRFIRGTLKYTTFVAALQLMEMMAYAVKHFRKEQLVSVTLRWFTKFAERKGFSEFINYVKDRGLIVQ